MSVGRVRGEAGLAGAEILPLAVLTFVIGSLLVANAWAVVDARVAAGSAAREAARAYVEAPDPVSATDRARAAAQAVLSGHGRDPSRAQLRIGHPSGAAWGRCVRVVIEVRYPIPALALGGLSGGPGTFEVVASHSEVVDPYRDDVPGAACG